MDTQLTGKRALVTGAASGIGRAIAEAFAREGAIVAVHARSAERAGETIASITEAGGKCFAVAADLMDSAAIRLMCEEAIARLGGLDIVVNNAGVYDYASVVDMSEELWDRILDTNLKAPFLMSKHTLPAMIEQGTGGRVIFNASTAGKTADALFGAYNASKHGLIGLARCLAAELGEKGITVNAICPGWIDTKMVVGYLEKWSREHGLDYDDLRRQQMEETNTLHTSGEPEDIADLALYLASERGRFIHGQAISVCGGLCYW